MLSKTGSIHLSGGDPIETGTKDGNPLSASLPKDSLYLSPILLMKRLYHQKVCAQKDHRELYRSDFFCFDISNQDQGRRNSAVEIPHLPIML